MLLFRSYIMLILYVHFMHLFFSSHHQKKTCFIVTLAKRLKTKCDRSEDADDEEEIKPTKTVANKSIDEEKIEGDEIAVEALAVEEENSLSRTSCHDSGIDIRDAIPVVPIIPVKKVRPGILINKYLLSINNCLLML